MTLSPPEAQNTRENAGQNPGHDTGHGAALKTRYRVGGMDCASCAAKIEAAALRIPGIQDVSVSVAAGTVLVRHGAGTDLAMLQVAVGRLGYSIAPAAAAPDTEPAASLAPDCAGHDHAQSESHTHAHTQRTAPASKAGPASAPPAGPVRLFANAKARLTVICGAALAAAFLFGLVFPALEAPAFLAAMLVGLLPIARRAVAAARIGMPFTIEMLMTVAALGAVLIGAVEEAAAVVFLFLVGELLEGFAAGRARASISALADLVPKTALRLREGELTEVPAADLAVEDVILVRPGARIPADGEVVSGESAVDEAPVTGESVPVTKAPGGVVYAGTVNGDGALTLRVTARAQDNTIARIVALVEEAQEAKAPTERFIDRFARGYTPFVVVLAALVAVVPPLVFGGVWDAWIYKGLAILLIGCPCALVISTPAAIAAGLSAGARRGLLMKGGGVLEAIGRVDTVCFDKTGTLTQGRPQVTDILGSDPNEVLRIAAALEAGSSHPLAAAIRDRAAAQSLRLPPVEAAQALGGKGVSGTVDGRACFLGAPAAAFAQAPTLFADQIAALEEEGNTVAVLVVEGAVAGALAMRDTPRPDARAALQALAAEERRTLMLTGDNPRAAAAVGRDLGIEVRAGLLPQDKQAIVTELRRAGHIVAKVGDGINDAPALAAADVGIAMGGGTDVALETADAAILHGRVSDVAHLIALSRATMGNIRQNIAIALGLKAVFLVTTLLGITGLWPSILADTGATVLVTVNALRLLGWTPSGAERQAGSRPA